MIRFTSNTFAVEAAGPDGEARRTITGIAVPFLPNPSDISEI